MPRSEEANIQIKGDRRKQILLAALNVFINRGFAAAKVSDIATEAGISYGLSLMYHYFQSKEEIYAELVTEAVESSKRGIEHVRASGAEPIDMIRSIVGLVFKAVGQHQSVGYSFLLWMEAMTSRGDAFPHLEYPIGHGAPFHMLSDMIEEGQRKGQIAQGDPAELVTMLLSAMLGLASLRVSGTISTMPDPDILMRIFQPALPTKR
ncbi:MAG: TetR/AcrR family transcriptional regulator [Candidatus Cryosericum sp.]|nr:TetR/AcrR family transcriptional regulator [bacterium]